MELTVDSLEFHLDKVPQKFVIINNLQQAGIAIENVFGNWIRNSVDITAESLCKFIRSQNTNIICLTQDEYLDLAGRK